MSKFVNVSRPNNSRPKSGSTSTSTPSPKPSSNRGNSSSGGGNRRFNNSSSSRNSGNKSRSSRGEWSKSINRSRSNRGRGGRRGGGRPKAQNIHRSLYISDNTQQDQVEKNSYEGKKYTELGLGEKLMASLSMKGYEYTTEIQEKAIPLILQGVDVLGISATGSGKTGAFLIPMIQKMLDDQSQRLLIVAPTRELALQISREAISLLKGTQIRPTLIIGGESMGKQIAQMKQGGRLVVGTPGRLKDMINRSVIKPNLYNNLVLDEVDRMLDMGFITDIRYIFDLLAKKKQSLFFSATHNDSVEKIVDSLSESFDIIKLANNTASKSVVQSVIDYTHSDEKMQKLEEILRREDVAKAIVFVETKRFADRIERDLKRRNLKVSAIHGDKRQNVRKRVIETFKSSRIDVLVATNVAARGIDIDDITHVINLDEPQTYDEYIHRIGRTGRNGSTGTAYTFVKRS